MEIIVIKRDGTKEMYEESKVSESIMAAAIEVGGEDYDLADDLAEAVTDLLLTNNIKSLTSAELEIIIRNMLIDEGHSSTATKYIEFAAARSKQREMDSSLMHSYEEITFQSGEASDMKRENANINSESSMGVMLKYGSEGAKKFNLNYIIDPKISKHHIDGDIHIHDLDFYTLTETCASWDTKLDIKMNNNAMDVTFKKLADILKLNEVDVVKEVTGIKVKSFDKYVSVKNIVSHKPDGKRMLEIKCKAGLLKVTSDHRVTVNKCGEYIDVKADTLKTGDILVSHGKNIDDLTVISIEELEYTDLVYDMETEDHHFNANGFVVHNCCQIPLDKLFKGGFNTGHGFLREPGNIRSAGALAAIAIQSNQNDMHSIVLV